MITIQHRQFPGAKALTITILLLCATACSTVEKTAPPSPFWARIKQAAEFAAKDTTSWLPLAGASTIAIAGLDHKISDAAREHNYLFGSTERANDVSDHLRDICVYSVAITELVRPQRDNGLDWLSEKSQNLSLQAISLGVTSELTGTVKEATERLRPNEGNRRSFPSGHSSAAFAASALDLANIKDNPLLKNYSIPLQAGYTSLAALTAWARVEAGQHYPTDVLVGAGLGNFVAQFFNHAWIHNKTDRMLSVSLQQNKIFFVFHMR